MRTAYQPGLHRYAVAVAAATLLLLKAGGLVTSNDAGLSVPDWPLSYGTWLPPMVGGILYEHGHRMIATFVGLLTIGLAVWISCADDRPAMRRLGWAALGLVIVQGLLGGLTVILLLPRIVSIAHATLAQVFFSTVVLIALLTSRWWRSPQPMVAYRGGAPLTELALCLFGAVFLQLLLGAAFRHDFVGVIPHLVGGFVVLGAAALVVGAVRRRYPEVPTLARLAAWLGWLVTAQIALGFFTLWTVIHTADAPQPMPLMVVTTVVHLALGAVILASSLVMFFVALRLFEPERIEFLLNGEGNGPAGDTRQWAPGRLTG